MSGELIGEVQLSTGGFVRVSVSPVTGELYVRPLTRDHRYRDCHGLDLAAVDANAVAQLVLRAAALAPSIKAAHEVRQRAVQTAEATYERIVANAIGRAQ
ncbi:hypothetical protein [Mycolicibacterium conceptionense]|uniref:hypothetical protein n=1 Tax=Mycolicibacterium conceptionense TaxID=451644 RepID=UPI00096E8047|nr:hypothetical protein [Mycolicibacterium conceptionense]OMB79230.1 hypothetical protein A5743_14085 [Mycolicibacterium conceptionense]